MFNKVFSVLMMLLFFSLIVIIFVAFGVFDSYRLAKEHHRFTVNSIPKLDLDHESIRIAFVEGEYKQRQELNVCLIKIDQCYVQDMGINDTYDLLFIESSLAYVHTNSIKLWDYEHNTVQQVSIPHPVSRLFSIDEQHIIFSHDRTLYIFNRKSEMINVLYIHSHLIRDAFVTDNAIVINHSENSIHSLIKVTSNQKINLSLPKDCLNGKFAATAYFVIGCQNKTIYVPLDSFEAVEIPNSGGQLIATMNETMVYSTLGPVDPTSARRSTKYSTVYATDLRSGQTINLRIQDISNVYGIQALDYGMGFILSGVDQQSDFVVIWYEMP